MRFGFTFDEVCLKKIALLNVCVNTMAFFQNNNNNNNFRGFPDPKLLVLGTTRTDLHGSGAGAGAGPRFRGWVIPTRPRPGPLPSLKPSLYIYIYFKSFGDMDNSVGTYPHCSEYMYLGTIKKNVLLEKDFHTKANE
ncbi:hypothetical protein LguiB_027198 [Lonicera macranthoides]